MIFPAEAVVLVISAVVSCGLVLVGARVMSRATAHYREAQTVIRAIITTYGQRLQHQEQTCQTVSNELGRVRALCEKLEKGREQTTNTRGEIPSSAADLVAAMKEVSNNIVVLNQTLRTSETTVGRPASLTGSESSAIALPLALKAQEMTRTEFDALKILATEGNKTSTELHGRVGRSREHFSRLMKRLYERGYVDRDTSKTPFVYRINESVARNVLEETVG